jgi:hypothetical protein
VAVETWYDKLAAVWDIDDGKSGTLLSYRLDSFPDALNHMPCAISVVQETSSIYSAGGVCVDIHRGRTEVHLTSDVNKAKLPYVMGFIKKLRDAAAANMKLDDTVSYFVLTERRSVRLAVMRYGDEMPHYGLVVEWIVKENVSGQFEVSG